MYCINCGVELADSETVCPLCGTVLSNVCCCFGVRLLWFGYMTASVIILLSH